MVAVITPRCALRGESLPSVVGGARGAERYILWISERQVYAWHSPGVLEANLLGQGGQY
jgi:hypothetical protein